MPSSSSRTARVLRGSLPFGRASPPRTAKCSSPLPPATDPLADLAPCVEVAASPYVLVVGPSIPAATVGDLVRVASAGSLAYASPGTRTLYHLSTELFARAAGVRLTHVPYRGSAPAYQHLSSGRVDVMFDLPASLIEPIRAGRVRALAVTSSSRLSMLPEVPTTAEAGFPDVEAEVWVGLFAGSRTPAARRRNGACGHGSHRGAGLLGTASRSRLRADRRARRSAASPLGARLDQVA